MYPSIVPIRKGFHALGTDRFVRSARHPRRPAPHRHRGRDPALWRGRAQPASCGGGRRPHPEDPPVRLRHPPDQLGAHARRGPVLLRARAGGGRGADARRRYPPLRRGPRHRRVGRAARLLHLARAGPQVAAPGQHGGRAVVSHPADAHERRGVLHGGRDLRHAHRGGAVRRPARPLAAALALCRQGRARLPAAAPASRRAGVLLHPRLPPPQLRAP
jgi:hypothetical protein